MKWMERKGLPSCPSLAITHHEKVLSQHSHKNKVNHTEFMKNQDGKTWQNSLHVFRLGKIHEKCSCLTSHSRFKYAK